MYLALLIPAFLFGVLIVRALIRSFTNSKRPRFPGPKGLPIIGSVKEVDPNASQYAFKKWIDEYGPVCEVNLFGTRAILIGTEEAGHRFFVAKSNVISGRPETAVIEDSQGHGGSNDYLPLMGYNEHHHRQKRAGKALLSMAQSDQWHGAMTIEIHRFLHKLATEENGKSSNAWLVRVEDTAARIICRVMFGSPDHGARLTQYAWSLLKHVSPNGALPNVFPILSRLPSFLSPWKKYEAARKAEQRAWFMQLLEETRARLRSGTAPPSLVRRHLETSTEKSERSVNSYMNDVDASRGIGMLATAAIFTNAGPISNFVRALAVFPEWAPRLQAEMDEVCPASRLPTLADMPRLLLLRAFIREVVRWRHVIPTGIPHEVDADVWVDGVLLEKGTIVFGVEYAMARDPARYVDPFGFDPMRWIDPASPLRREPTETFPCLTGLSMFGWGGRYCLGTHISQDEIYSFAANIVWAFNVTATRPEQFDERLAPGERRGGMTVPKGQSDGFSIIRPDPVDLRFEVRSAEHAAAIARAFEEDKKMDVCRMFDAVTVE